LKKLLTLNQSLIHNSGEQSWADYIFLKVLPPSAEESSPTGCGKKATDQLPSS
jgi:hypothetical protein